MIATPFLLSSCWWLNDSNSITVHERYVSQYAYFDKYIKPTNPDAVRGSFEAYQFLKKKTTITKEPYCLQPGKSLMIVVRGI